MKHINLLIMAVILGAILSACGSDERQETITASSPSSSAPTAFVTAGPIISRYTVTLLNTAADSYAVALNDSGQVVGNYLDADRHLNAFHWQGEKVETVVENGQVSRINNHGQIVGWREVSGQSEAFLYDVDGSLVRLNTLGGESQALAINESGQTAGRITLDAERAFIDQTNAMQYIAEDINGYAIAMNNLGAVLIKEVSGNRCRTLLWQHGTLTDLGDLGGPLTIGRDINDAGQVVGWAQTGDGEYHPFLWEGGVMTDLSAYTSDFGAAVAINEAGVILLKTSDIGGGRNLLLDHGTLIDLGNFGSRYAIANDLNDRGQIVGWMSESTGKISAFLATPTF